MADDELLDAWNELHEATPRGWIVCKPAYDERRDQWSLYAYDANERPKVGHRSREWTAVAPTQARVLRGMTICLREITAGRAPR